MTESTACWRRYIASWEIRDDKLFLSGLEGRFQLEGEEAIFAEWVSKTLEIPIDQELIGGRRSYDARYKNILLVRIDHGVVVGQRYKDTDAAALLKEQSGFREERQDYRSSGLGTQLGFPQMLVAWLKANDAKPKILVRELGYKNITKGIKWFDKWVSGEVAPIAQHINDLAKLLDMTPDAIREVIEQDERVLWDIERARRQERQEYQFVEYSMHYKQRSTAVWGGTADTLEAAIQWGHAKALSGVSDMRMRAPSGEFFVLTTMGDVIPWGSEAPRGFKTRCGRVLHLD
ncbi:hypothetical protein KAI87_17815 [Myxococcota bacterium]|nr:hypothetical protein [Myxococcota bacterium]